MSEPVIGIDLGTSNSVVAVVEGDRAVVIPDKEGRRIHPSVVSFVAADRIIVGAEAKKLMTLDPQNTVSSVKRLIGRNFFAKEVKVAQETFPFGIVQGADNTPHIAVRTGTYAIPEICSHILRHLKGIAEDYLGRSLTKAVITVPANFTDTQRKATQLAGELSGLEVSRIINEPTAAALAYGFGRDLDTRLAVYDFGGGTFDITVLDVEGSIFHVLSTAGDSYLGGDDFDNRLVNYMVMAFRQRHDFDLTNDIKALQRLKAIAEKVKCELSHRPKVAVQVQELVNGPEGPIDLSFSITRDGFNQKCQDIVQRTFAVCDEALRAGGISADQVAEVILVGGSTKVPIVREMVERYFSTRPVVEINPDEVVAVGAAIQGAALRADLVDADEAFQALQEDMHHLEKLGPQTQEFPRPQLGRVPEIQRTLLMDVTHHALGVATLGGFYDVVIERNTILPTERTRLFTTTVDGQETVRVQVFQGEADTVEANEKLGELELFGLRKAPRGEVVIEVVFEVNIDGILNVTARDRETGARQSIRLRLEGGTSPEEQHRMLGQQPRTGTR
ncbi:MAG: Hsp70 family protein [Myxococcota bacterium]|jgi:molecular chaperone DnaK|nr:Hsp70 family protein [Myxococcota bacterium]